MAHTSFDPEALRDRYRQERDKRLRADANEQYLNVTESFAHYLDDPYVEPGFTRSPLADEIDVVVIGGGFGGLLAAGRLRDADIGSVRVIEKGGDFGGTWYWNRYPGAQCDVESYIYLPLLEELGYIPREKYSFAPEILEHSRAIGRHYDLYRDACFQTEVTRMEWDDAASRWIVHTNRGDRMRARFVCMSNGPLNRPKLPGIPGIETFAGHAFHTSRWDYGYTGGDSTGNLTGLRDKVVGVIGTGATAVQCVPHVGAAARHLYVLQRTPSSVDVRGNRPTDYDWAIELEAGWQQKRMDNFNILVTGGFQEVDLVGDGWTDLFRKLSRLGQNNASVEDRAAVMELADFEKMEEIRARVDSVVKDAPTAEALKPYYRQFCKRPCFNDEYLETFNRPNVTLVDTQGKGVERITPRGVVVADREYALDCLIFATGFEVGTNYTRRAGCDVVGRGGESLATKWARGLSTFHGLFSHGFPNCFFLGLTQTGLTPNFPHMLNEQAKHMTYVVQQALGRGAHTVEATPQAEADWVAEIKRTARLGERFFMECTPGYYNNEGKPQEGGGFFTDNYGAGSEVFFQILRDWRAKGDLAGLELG